MKKKIIRKNKKFLSSIVRKESPYNISEYLKDCKWRRQWDKSIKKVIKSHLRLPNFDKMFETSDGKVFIPYFSKGKFCFYGSFPNMGEAEALKRFWGHKWLRLNNRK
ncbi:hypothetical protein [Escherichia coli]|uniref:hypothetical protein n=1 Tax=Escherichia coli TaxID=562 RepID=UPI000E1D274E|nr:hypothetical protein [Escherichia coli]